MTSGLLTPARCFFDSSLGSSPCGASLLCPGPNEHERTLCAWQGARPFHTLRSMRPMRSLLVYLAVVFLGAAMLSPWVYWLAQSGAGHSGVLARLSAQPFHRYVNRCLLALAIIGLSP